MDLSEDKHSAETRALINNEECILFYDQRVPPEEAPIGYPYMYYIRHDEDNWVQPVSIEKYVLVNFFGTIFTKEELEFDGNEYIEIESFEMERKYIVFTLSKEKMGKMLGLE